MATFLSTMENDYRHPMADRSCHHLTNDNPWRSYIQNRQRGLVVIAMMVAIELLLPLSFIVTDTIITTEFHANVSTATMTDHVNQDT